MIKVHADHDPILNCYGAIRAIDPADLAIVALLVIPYGTIGTPVTSFVIYRIPYIGYHPADEYLFPTF
jgi:hypothetical protein